MSNSQEDSNSSSNDIFNSIFETLFGTSANVTLLIAVADGQISDISTWPDTRLNNVTNLRTRLLGVRAAGLLRDSNTQFPLFMVRSVFRALNNGQVENPNSTSPIPQFFEYIQEIFTSMKRKERIKEALRRDKPYIYKLKNGKQDECAICLDEFKHRERIRKLDCEHEFHKKCIDKWLTEGNSCCPTCRKEPFTSKKEEENLK